MKKKSAQPLIGLWAGSSPSHKKDLRAGFLRLKQFGWNLIIPQETKRYMARPESKVRAYLAGPDASKLKSFLSLWNNPRIQNIFCMRGGYGTLRLLRDLDSISLKKVDKRLWGYSDLTVIQNYLFQRLGTPWVHSPMITGHSFAKPLPAEARVWNQIQAGAERSVFEELVFNVEALHSPKQKVINHQNILMIGGNLASFLTLMGTPWEPNPRRSFLLFLEDTNEPPYKLDRLLQQLGAAKLMKKCQGIVLGHFTKMPFAHDVIRLWARENGFLTIAGVPAGHEAPNVPLPLGVKVTLELKKSGRGSLRVPFPFL